MVNPISIFQANVVAQTRIDYEKKQLLQLITQYLSKEGYESIALQLQKEANLPTLPPVMRPLGLNTSLLDTPTAGIKSVSKIFHSLYDLVIELFFPQRSISISSARNSPISFSSPRSSTLSDSTAFGTPSCATPIPIKLNK